MMPHGFEYVVRPYQSPGSQSNVVIPATPKGSRERAHLVWGGKGTMPSVRMLYPGTEVKICKENLTERDRDSDTVRIYGNDGESYVDVARPRKLRLNKDEFREDSTLSSTGYSSKKLDPSLDPSDFSTPVDPEWKSTWKSGWGACNVTWNLQNV